MTQYRLPCPHGHEVLIETKQAGQTVRCTCGVELDVPTMLGITQLEPAVAPSTPERRTGRRWGVRQQLVLIGGTITLLALVALAVEFWRTPRVRDVDDLTPGQTVGLWSDLRRGVEYRSKAEKWIHRTQRYYHRWMGVTGVIAGLGVLTILSSRFVPPDV